MFNGDKEIKPLEEEIIMEAESSATESEFEVEEVESAGDSTDDVWFNPFRRNWLQSFAIFILLVIIIVLLMSILHMPASSQLSFQEGYPFSTTTVNAISETTPILRVTGVGEVFAAPDVAVLHVGVMSEVASAEQGSQEVNVAMNRALELFAQLGIEESDITTVEYSINPQYDYGTTGRSTLLGYITRSTIKITVRDIEKTSRVLDAAISAGLNYSGGISYEVSNIADLRITAQTLALEHARAQADALAASGHFQIVSIRSIDTATTNSGYSTTSKNIAMGMDMMENTGTTVMPGEQNIMTQVVVNYVITG